MKHAPLLTLLLFVPVLCAPPVASAGAPGRTLTVGITVNCPYGLAA